MQDHHGEHRRQGNDAVLPGGLFIDGDPANAGYFHAQFRRVNPLPYKDNIVLLDSVRGKGQYVGTYLAWGVHNNGWWGEGEIKFYMDGDKDWPTICGTGTEDYFCGSYDFDTHSKNAAGVSESHYTEFSSPYSGLAQVIKGDGHYSSQQRFGLYRWHITDPIRFDRNLKVTIQALGWRDGGPLSAATGRYLLNGILVSDGTACAFPEAPVEGSAGSRLKDKTVFRLDE
jgi:hypothetical protein